MSWAEPQATGIRKEDCNWCPQTSTKAWKVAGKGYFIYTCPRHHQKGDDLAHALGKKGGG